MLNPARKEELILSCLSKKFYCHETMHQTNAPLPKWIGHFDPSRDQNGEPCDQSQHQVCAGFMRLFGEEFGVDPATIEGPDTLAGLLNGIPSEKHQE